MPGWVTLTNSATGQDELVDSDAAPTAIASGKYLDPGAVAVQRNGLATYTTPDVAKREQTFAPAIDPAQAALQVGHQVRERENTGAAATAEAFAGGATSALTVGLIDPFQEAREFNPIAGGLGVAAGAIAPALVGDVGGLFGAGREAALGEDALTAERAASSLSGKAIHSGETVAGTVERDLARGAAEVKSSAAAGAVERVTVPTAAAGPALEGMDAAGLKAAREGEIEAIEAARVPQREEFAGELEAFGRKMRDLQLSRGVTGTAERDAREAGKVLFGADRDIRRITNNPVGLARNPKSALNALETQLSAMEKLQAWSETETTRLLEERAGAPEAIREELLANKIPGYVVSQGGQGGGIGPNSPVIDDIVNRLFEERHDTQFALPKQMQRLQYLPDAIERNRDLQTKLKGLLAEPTSERLQQIDAMLAEHAVPHEASLGERVLHAIAPYAGPVGAVAEKAYAGIRKLVGAASKKASGAAESFVDVGARAAPKVPLIATRILAAAAFAPAAAATTAIAAATAPAPEKPAKKGAPAAVASTQDLHELYQKRSQEIRSLITFGPDGLPTMRQDARMELGAKFDAIRAMSPRLADQMETVRARGIEYLASIMPKPVDFGVMQIGPDRRRVSDLEMRAWSRAVGAVDDPHGVLERAAAGHIVPEEAAAMRAVYPEILDDFTAQVIGKLPTLRANLPYNRRLSLSMLTGVPVDPSMTSPVLNEIQSMYASEPGTAGGTQAPRPQPQFGSVKRSDPGTPAQRRQGMTA